MRVTSEYCRRVVSMCISGTSYITYASECSILRLMSRFRAFDFDLRTYKITSNSLVRMRPNTAESKLQDGDCMTLIAMSGQQCDAAWTYAGKNYESSLAILHPAK